MPGSNAWTRDRAQTGIDFFVGMGVFLLALAFVLAFVPSMFAPFFGMGVGDALSADRGAAYLVEDALVDDPTKPGVLNETTVNAFFDECAGDELHNELGTRSSNVNVTIGDDWACGPSPTDADTVSRRIVTVEGTQYTLRVVVW